MSHGTTRPLIELSDVTRRYAGGGARYRRGQVGMIFQFFNLLDD
jgi:ABC-type lipoprotein export system ATPase subunit